MKKIINITYSIPENELKKLLQIPTEDELKDFEFSNVGDCWEIETTRD